MDELAVVDDTLLVVCLHATPGVTLDLLTSFLPDYVYKENVWKQKTIVESRGLIVDRDVIDLVRRGNVSRWYAYYLTQNRTFCGDFLAIKGPLSKDPTTVTKMRDVIYYHAFRILGTRKITIVQHRDLTLTIKRKNYRNIIPKIRQVVLMMVQTDEAVVPMLAILDEVGDVWLHRNDNGVVERLVTGEGIVGIDIANHSDNATIDKQPLLMLNRYGQARYLSKTAYLDSPKIVSLRDSKFTYDNSATRGDGHLISITPDPYKWIDITNQTYRKLGKGEVFLSGYITTKLRPMLFTPLPKKLEVVIYTMYRIHIAADRTAYTSYKPIPNTTHRAQSVGPDWVIVDA